MALVTLQKDLRLLRSIIQTLQPVTSSIALPATQDFNLDAGLSAGRRKTAHSCPPHSKNRRDFSLLSRPSPNYPGHVPLTSIERVGLAVGSAITSLINPRRHDMVAACGEATAQPFFIRRLRDRMLQDPTGRRILKDRPRITSQTLKLEELREMKEGSVGRTYAMWLDREGVTPDTRDAVRYIDNEEEAYVMQRYRECHDFYHAIAGLPVFVEGEIALKAFEFANTGLPMTGLSLAAVIRLKPAERRRFFDVYLPWAIKNGSTCKDLINVYWEEELETDVEELRARMGIEQPPDLREARKKARDEKRRLKAEREMLAGTRPANSPSPE